MEFIKTAKKIFCVLIMVVVFLFAGTTTFLIVNEGLRSDTSNYKLVTSLIESQLDMQGTTGQEAKADTTCEAPKTNIEISSADFSPSIFSKNEMNLSFDSEAKFAYETGANRSIGIYGDNGTLLKYLLSKFSQSNPCQSS
jgi:hypothetical protein